MWVMVFPGLLTFFLSNITLVHCGKQSFFKFDCQELQFVVYVAMLVTGICGTSFWYVRFYCVGFKVDR